MRTSGIFCQQVYINVYKLHKKLYLKAIYYATVWCYVLYCIRKRLLVEIYWLITSFIGDFKGFLAKMANYWNDTLHGITHLWYKSRISFKPVLYILEHFFVRILEPWFRILFEYNCFQLFNYVSFILIQKLQQDVVEKLGSDKWREHVTGQLK